MTQKKKVPQKKKIKKSKAKSLVPEVVKPDDKYPAYLAMDSTAHIEISLMQNVKFSQEIVQEARDTFSLEKLDEEKEKGQEELLLEGERQISKLWHSIEALTVHNTLFVVLFLISIGEILNKVKASVRTSDYVSWRNEIFYNKQPRYLQQAQQLARMGKFAKIYASMGKKRLLALDHLRKAKKFDTHEKLLDEYPLSEEIKDDLITGEILKDNPFPDTTADMEGDLLKEHVDGVITFERLNKIGINFITFEQACLMAAFEKNALGLKTVNKIKAALDEIKTVRKKKKWLDILIMDKMKFPGEHPSTSQPRESINKMLADFVSYCKNTDITDKSWIDNQRELLDEDTFLDANKFIKFLAGKFKIKLSTRKRAKTKLKTKGKKK